MRKASVFYTREQSTMHTLRRCYFHKIQAAEDVMWHKMMEVYAGEFGKTTPCLIPEQVNGVGVDLLADTGATISVISERMAKELRLDYRIEL